MLSRRHLRIKVMQSLYGWFSAGFESVGSGEKELLLSINRFYELFLYQLQFLSEIRDVAEKQLEDSKQKHIPTKQDLNPNTRFIQNPFLVAISNNSVINDLYAKKKISWVGENEIVRRIFANIRSSEAYIKYISSEKNSFEEDKEIIVNIIKNHIVDFPPLMQFYEDRSIFWVDDIDIVNIILINVVKSCKDDTIDSSISGLEWFVDDEDRAFATDLFRKTIMSSEKLEKRISEKTLNWEAERIAMMDFLLMKMALCELLEFPSIPVKVTLNEYIDLSKMYSTPKSSIFINGILDKLIADMKETNEIKKAGRGLM